MTGIVLLFQIVFVILLLAIAGFAIKIYFIVKHGAAAMQESLERVPTAEWLGKIEAAADAIISQWSKKISNIEKEIELLKTAQLKGK